MDIPIFVVLRACSPVVMSRIGAFAISTSMAEVSRFHP
jgi:hypothetical protein